MHNPFNQPVGEPVTGFSAGQMPAVQCLQGKFCRLEKLDAQRHADDLWLVYGESSAPQNWTYLPAGYGPFANRADFHRTLQTRAASADPYVFAIIDLAEQQAVGTFSLMRINCTHRVIEVGAVIYSDQLKRTKTATEAQYLLACYVFDVLQYRRYEWKCDALNAPSRRAATRLGFTFEGIFRQAQVYRGRNRDTAWYSLLDREWPAQKCRFERWLADDNFDRQGRQKKRLQDC
ncbi:GNAT family N-acetyltransferase [Necropsobacter rosorum]|uniref:GNAT family N-acetyltransferase n=1 Tax=Necropsobacter rosorum TaxID=908285 RepID=UPI000509E6C7